MIPFSDRIEGLVREHEAQLLKAWDEYFESGSSDGAGEVARVTARALFVELCDGRTVSVPLQCQAPGQKT